MNAAGLISFPLIIGYLLFLCVSAVRRLRRMITMVSPVDLLNFVSVSRRHYGLHATICITAAPLFVGAKSIALLAGAYAAPGYFGQLAFGTADGQDLVSKLGLNACLLLVAFVFLSLAFIKYNAYLRILFVLREYLHLDIQLLQPRNKKAEDISGSPKAC